MTISQKDAASASGSGQGLPVDARIAAAAAVVVSLVGLAIVAVAWMPGTVSFVDFAGLVSFLPDASLAMVAALALSAAAIGWLYLRFRHPRSEPPRGALEARAGVSDDRWKAVAGRLSDLQAQLTNIHERQTYLRATLSTLQAGNEELRSELDAVKADVEEARERRAATNERLLGAVEALANESLTSLETQSSVLHRLREDVDRLSETVGPSGLRPESRTAADRP